MYKPLQNITNSWYFFPLNWDSNCMPQCPFRARRMSCATVRHGGTSGERANTSNICELALWLVGSKQLKYTALSKSRFKLNSNYTSGECKESVIYFNISLLSGDHLEGHESRNSLSKTACGKVAAYKHRPFQSCPVGGTWRPCKTTHLSNTSQE